MGRTHSDLLPASPAASAARDDPPRRRSFSSHDRPAPSVARGTSGRSTAGPPAAESTHVRQYRGSGIIRDPIRQACADNNELLLP
jgi:hypothetical protein